MKSSWYFGEIIINLRKPIERKNVFVKIDYGYLTFSIVRLINIS